MRKQLILASLAALLVIGTPVAEAKTSETNATPYTDIADHWARKEIETLYIAGAVGDAESFRPNEPITRGELVTMFVKAKGIAPGTSSESPFADIPAGSWMAPFAETAYRLGIVHGKKQGSQLLLQADEPVTREELVSILIRTKGDSGAVNQLKWSTTIQTLAKYPDGQKVDKSCQRAFVYALEKGLVSPYADGTLKPKSAMTRAEAATYAALHLVNSKAAKSAQLFNGTAYRQALTVQTTAYSNPNQPILSYLEYPLREGVVAVDPSVIPLGSHLYIDGYGYAVAADIGGAVKQRHVDLYLPTLQEARSYGMKQGVKVYVLD